MSEPSRIIQLLDRSYTKIWHEGQMEETLRGLDDDFEWEARDYLEDSMRRGPQAVIGFFREWMDAWEELEVDWDLRELDPERAFVVIHMRGRSRGSGVPAEMHFGQIWTMRDNRFKRMVMYTDVQQARRAAGLDP
jgi:ketosteroid isomerase-like protein